MFTDDQLFAEGYVLEVSAGKERHFDRLMMETGGSVVVWLRKGVELRQKGLPSKLQRRVGEGKVIAGSEEKTQRFVKVLTASFHPLVLVLITITFTAKKR